MESERKREIARAGVAAGIEMIPEESSNNSMLEAKCRRLSRCYDVATFWYYPVDCSIMVFCCTMETDREGREESRRKAALTATTV